MHLLDRFTEVVLMDFEFISRPGERQTPVCMVAWELRSGRKWRIWKDEFPQAPPFPTGHNTVFISYLASAELGCYHTLGWPMPERIVDLFVEFRNLTNGRATIAGNSLRGALAHFGLDSLGADEKETMRKLVLRGEPWSRDEQQAILNYCESDVDGLYRLLPRMEPTLDLGRALLRGRYMGAVAGMEHAGVPVNVVLLGQLVKSWDKIKDELIARVDADYRIFEGRTFKIELFENFLAGANIPWPRLPSGQLDLADDTFREMSRIWPIIAPVRELRHTLSQLRLADLAVGSDGRNRCMLSPFASVTSRNQPSNAKFIFGPSVWLRNLITPPPGHGLAYIDYSQQEVAIAASLSKDPAMLAAYQSGDSYLAFAKQAGAVPESATKESHPTTRDLYKVCALAVQYTMGARSLAARIGKSEFEARRFLQHHREIYRQYWQWLDNLTDHAVLSGFQQTVFGWTRWIPAGGRELPKRKDGHHSGNGKHDDQSFNPRSLRNFPMQAHGAEMLRLAVCLGVERGIEICAPIHDAVLICAPLDQLETDVARMRQSMAEASRIVLNGFEIRTDAKLICYPDHYSDPRGERLWREILSLLPTVTA